MKRGITIKPSLDSPTAFFRQEFSQLRCLIADSSGQGSQTIDGLFMTTIVQRIPTTCHTRTYPRDAHEADSLQSHLTHPLSHEQLLPFITTRLSECVPVKRRYSFNSIQRKDRARKNNEPESFYFFSALIGSGRAGRLSHGKLV